MVVHDYSRAVRRRLNETARPIPAAFGLFGFVLAATIFCSCSSDGARGSTAQSSGICKRPVFDDAGAGVTACTAGAAYVQCTFPNGAGCLCISDDPKSCPSCNASNGAECHNGCSDGEYALSCGGPPQVRPDGGIGNAYQDPPSGCRSMGGTPGGNQFLCCPCL